jgi:hypothetical protein
MNDKTTCIALLQREYPQFAALVEELLSVDRFRLPGEGNQRERTLAAFRRHIRDESIVEEIAHRLYALDVRILPDTYRQSIGAPYRPGIALTAQTQLEDASPEKVADSTSQDPTDMDVETPTASDTADVVPGRVQTTTYRILRDTQIARHIKILHEHKCQLCGHTIVLPDGTRYAEAHHIKPLGEPHNGPDVAGNILCLCPNHHTEMDYLVVPIKQIAVVPQHAIDQAFVDYHNKLHAEARSGMGGASEA